MLGAFTLVHTLIFAGALAAEERPIATVRGAVVDEDGRPVAGAVVTLMPGALRDTTDVSGSFRFDGVPAGSFTLTASKQSLGLRDTSMRVAVPLADGRPVVLVMRGRTYETDEVIVVSAPSKREDRGQGGTGMVEVMERSAFEGRARTVADVLRGSPGATVRSTGGLGDYTEVSLRGANAQQVQVYVDGMLLNEAVGGAVNLATVPLAHARSIEVWRSGAPARFGGGAAGGTVNIRTWDFLSKDRMISLGYGSFNTVNAQTLIQACRGASRFLFSAGYASSENDFRFKSDNGTVYNPDDDIWCRRKNDAFRSFTLLGKYRSLLGETAILELSDLAVSNSKELPGKDIVQESRATFDTERNLLQAKLALNPFLHRGIEAEPTLHSIYTRERYRDLGGSVGWGAQDNLYRTHALRFILPLTARVGGHAAFSLTPGADHESYCPGYRLQATIPLSCDRDHLSIVLDSSLRLLAERLVLSATASRARYYSTFSGQPSPLNRVTPRPVYNRMTNLTTGFRFTVVSWLSLTGNYGDVTRAPGFYELFGDRGTTVSNPNLKPERIFRRDLGARAAAVLGPADFSIECARFSNRNRNLIQWYTNNAGFLFADNVTGSYVRGTELVWSVKLRRLSCSGNRTFQDARVTDEKNRIYRGKKLPNRPDTFGSMLWELRLPLITPWWRIDDRGPYFLDRANQPQARYPGRTLHDLGISAPLPALRSTLTVEARNITDEHTFDTQGMPLPGWSFTVTMTWRTGT